MYQLGSPTSSSPIFGCSSDADDADIIAHSSSDTTHPHSPAACFIEAIVTSFDVLLFLELGGRIRLPFFNFFSRR